MKTSTVCSCALVCGVLSLVNVASAATEPFTVNSRDYKLNYGPSTTLRGGNAKNLTLKGGEVKITRANNRVTPRFLTMGGLEIQGSGGLFRSLPSPQERS
jgi:hypothetical protein